MSLVVGWVVLYGTLCLAYASPFVAHAACVVAESGEEVAPWSYTELDSHPL